MKYLQFSQWEPKMRLNAEKHHIHWKTRTVYPVFISHKPFWFLIIQQQWRKKNADKKREKEKKGNLNPILKCYDLLLLLVLWCICFVLSTLLDWLAKQTKLLSANMNRAKINTFCEENVWSVEWIDIQATNMRWKNLFAMFCLLLYRRKWQDIRIPSINQQIEGKKAML